MLIPQVVMSEGPAYPPSPSPTTPPHASACSHRERLRAGGLSRAAVEARPSAAAQGPLFRSLHRSGRVRAAALPASRVPVILKDLAVRAGLDPDLAAGLSEHSPRVGAAQDLRASGASLLDLQAEGGWRD